MSEHISSVKSDGLIWLALLALLGLTVIAHAMNWGAAAALVIAALKTLLVGLFFMHLRFRPHLMWLAAAGGIYWFAILLTLSYSDYATRGMLQVPGK
jgi:cytochrome c oxidase subunit 4